MRRRRLQETRGIARHLVHFEVQAARRREALPNVVTLSVCGMISTEKVSPLDLVDRERNAVERDRAFRRDKARSVRGHPQHSRAMSGKSSRVSSSAMPSTWPLTIWPPSSSPSAQRAFEVEPGAALPGSRGGHPERLGRHIDGEEGAIAAAGPAPPRSGRDRNRRSRRRCRWWQDRSRRRSSRRRRPSARSVDFKNLA